MVFLFRLQCICTRYQSYACLNGQELASVLVLSDLRSDLGNSGLDQSRWVNRHREPRTARRSPPTSLAACLSSAQAHLQHDNVTLPRASGAVCHCVPHLGPWLATAACAHVRSRPRQCLPLGGLYLLGPGQHALLFARSASRRATETADKPADGPLGRRYNL